MSKTSSPEQLSIAVDQKLASPAPEGVKLSPSSRSRRPWDTDLRLVETFEWHVLWWKVTGEKGRGATHRGANARPVCFEPEVITTLRHQASVGTGVGITRVVL